MNSITGKAGSACKNKAEKGIHSLLSISGQSWNHCFSQDFAPMKKQVGNTACRMTPTLSLRKATRHTLNNRSKYHSIAQIIYAHPEMNLFSLKLKIDVMLLQGSG